MLSWWLITYVNSVLGLLLRVIVGDDAEGLKANSASIFRVELRRLVTVYTWARVGICALSIIIHEAGPSSDSATGTELVFNVLIEHTAGHKGNLTLYRQAL
jgi:hypothetical protein